MVLQFAQISRLHQWLLLSGLAGLYVLAGKIGLQLAELHPSASPVWPPTAISLAALVLLGYRAWPAIFLGAFIVNVTTAGSVATSLGIATGNTLEGLSGAYLIHRFANGRTVFARQRDAMNFVLLAAVLSTTVSATIGVTSLVLGGYAQLEQYRMIWITWWLGDAVGALIMTPAIVLWASEPTIARSRSQWVEVGVSITMLCVVTLMVFHSGTSMTVADYPLGLLAFSVLVWIAVRLGPRDTATAVLLCAGIAIWGTLRGYGPFAQARPQETLLLLQAFMAVIAVTALVLAVGVSERRQAEESLDRLNQTLERRIQDRTSRLQTTVAQLQELDRLKSAFVSIVSHELRTPLTSIKGLTDNMIEGVAGPLNEKQSHYLHRIQRNADRLTRMLNGLLDLSKIEAGKMELRQTELSLLELVDEVVEVFQPLAQRKSITLESRSIDDVPKVFADRDKLYEVLANLLDNAIKFTPSDGRVLISTGIRDDRHVEVQVSDTGCGIPEHHLPNIFDKFYQAPSLSGNPTGAGLGLAIAKGLIELHGGTIAVDRMGGKGTRFSVTVPHRTGEAA